MSWALIRAELGTRLASVSGVENVHQYRRHNNDGFDSTAFANLFTVAEGSLKRYDGWMIEHKGMTEVQCLDDDATVKRTHRVEIFGFRSLVDGDATANIFSDLVEDVLNEFHTVPRTLNDTCLTHGLVQAGDIDTSLFYGQLCHTVTLTLEIEENV